MGIERDAIRQILQQEVVTLRLTTDNKTAIWAVNTKDMLWLPGNGAFAFQLTGNVIGAEFNEALDERIANQRTSIEDLLGHLKIHCPKLLGTGECGRIGAL
jgi:hypothetical protein